MGGLSSFVTMRTKEVGDGARDGGVVVRMEAKPGQEAAAASFLEQAQPVVEDEPGTIAWFAVRLSESEFAIFDVFEDDNARADHLGGDVAAALLREAPQLFVEMPTIERIDVLAAKLPG
jgi:quinol monooxygenase YgiN